MSDKEEHNTEEVDPVMVSVRQDDLRMIRMLLSKVKQPVIPYQYDQLEMANEALRKVDQTADMILAVMDKYAGSY